MKNYLIEKNEKLYFFTEYILQQFIVKISKNHILDCKRYATF